MQFWPGAYSWQTKNHGSSSAPAKNLHGSLFTLATCQVIYPLVIFVTGLKIPPLEASEQQKTALSLICADAPAVTAPPVKNV
ncbi:hypothetical protein [Moorella sp. E308F]|uniref:hypothetical protein n=1 Tax=Moorella sp. E308F TaxID=2572682 RepID=UPI001C0ECDEA|nr:hypothetical protein [Moorella sp. E308F]